MTRPGEFSPATVQLIWDRDRGRCAMPGCQNPVLVRERRAEPFGGWSVQHREARGRGGVKRNSDRPHLILPSNGVLLCGTGTTGCHGDVEHHRDNVDPAWGFSVSRLGMTRPADVPLFHASFGWVRLDDAGGLSDDPIVFEHSLQIASPPCQSFSLAGKGAGRAALDDVLRAIDDRAFERPERLRSLGAETDDRTALVLTPLAHVHRDRPMFVTWEQVPPALPVWEACAAVMRDMGYSVWVGIIRAEQYGVPQTRRRAVLIARADGIEAAPPTPTHSRYYEREPQRLDDGVLPWVSMADTFGAYGTRALRSNYGTGGDSSRRGERLVTQPAPTITSKAGRNKWDGRRPMWIVEAAALQTYPRGFVFGGTAGAQFLQIGNAVPPLMGGALIDELFAPAALRVVSGEVAA